MLGYTRMGCISTFLLRPRPPQWIRVGAPMAGVCEGGPDYLGYGKPTVEVDLQVDVWRGKSITWGTEGSQTGSDARARNMMQINPPLL